MLNYPIDQIERQLAHAERNEVRAAYNRAKHLPERRKMMQAWSDYLDGLRSGAKVVPIKKVRLSADVSHDGVVVVGNVAQRAS